jgi:hypothetical protein
MGTLSSRASSEAPEHTPGFSGGGGSRSQTAVSSFGSAGSGSGAKLNTKYHDREQHVVSISMDDLRDFKTSSTEEFIQFSIGGFLASGSFWLGIERFVTIAKWQSDFLFWLCAISFVAGTVIGIFGWRQLARRKGRIESIIEAAEKHHKDS